MTSSSLARLLFTIILTFGLVLVGCTEEVTTPEANQGGDGDGDSEADGDGASDGDTDSDGDGELIDECNPVTDDDCDCRAGQFQLCSSAGDPNDFPVNSQCIAGFQRCVQGEWEDECHGEYTPPSGDCSPAQSADDCDGFINEFGDCVDGGTGTAPDDSVYCPDGEGGGLGDPCSCEVPEDGEEFRRIGQPCYTGPSGTLGVGICHGGTRDCQPDGTWGPCEGETTPDAQETCGDGLDNTCSGTIDDGCEYCPPGVEDCDAYNSGYLNEPCPDGSPRNECGGCYEVADEEVCGDGFDTNCSGTVDEGCGCTGTSQLCYPGPSDKAGIGECNFGVQQCQGEFWGPCVGYTLPTPELCGPDGTGNGQDNNCSGIIDEGCGCFDGDTRPCGSNVGQCEMGTQTCTDGEWGECEGGVEPQVEICDGLDNNCNGIADDGLRNACGQCEGPCYTHQTDTNSEDFFEEGLEFLDSTDEDNPTGKDGVTLTQQSVFPNYLWAANSGSGNTVSKVDTDTGLEVGRYRVANNPSRTAVDLDGNVWVVGRGDGRVTKVLWNQNDCEPGVPTSERDANGNVSVVNDSDILADGCVPYTATPGSAHGYNSGRGLAVDANGQIWVGYSDNGGAIQRINPNDTSDISVPYPTNDMPVFTANTNGDVVAVPGSTGSFPRVYGLVGDSQGNIYALDWAGSQGLARFDTNTQQWDMYLEGFGCGTYGIAIDAEDRIWSGCSSGNSPATVYDPNTNKIHNFYVPGSHAGAQPRGTTAPAHTTCSGCATNWNATALAAEPNTGDIWLASAGVSGYLFRLSADFNDLGASTWTFIPATVDDNGSLLPGAGGGLMRGVGFDREGKVWHLGMPSTTIFQYDPVTLELLDSSNVGSHGHYTYSDFTGATAFNFTAPRGVFRYVFESGFPITRVDEIFVEATVPDSTTLGVRIRPLDENHNPITGDWYPDVGPQGSAEYFDYPVGEEDHYFDMHSLLGFPIEGVHFEVEIRMTRTDPEIRPFLHDLQLGWHRP